MKDNPHNTPAHVLVKTFAELRDLLDLYGAATTIQWERPPTNGDRNGGGSKGTHSDSTFSTVSDPARMEVRRAVVNVDKRIQRLHDEIAGLAGALDSAVKRWQG
jgi:hypothetical protein